MLKDNAAKIFTKHFYEYLFKFANLENGTPKHAFDFAIKNLIDENFEKEIIKYKIINLKAEYLNHRVFIENEPG